MLTSFFLGYKGKPILSGAIFSLGAFDPRFAILGLPLFLFYNKDALKNAVATTIATLGASNILLLYPGTAQGFLNMIQTSGITTPIYKFAWIPLIMLITLTAINAKQMLEILKHARVATKVAAIIFIIAVIIAAANTRFILNLGW